MIIQLVILIVLVGWLSVLTFLLNKTNKHYNRLVKDTKEADLMKVLDRIISELDLHKEEINNLKNRLQEQIDKNVYNIQKIGILRFNPFSDTGGDQSFVLSLLDGTDSGIILTSLHSRGSTRWYGKNVKSGKGVDHDLSEEEKKAIKQARLTEQIK